MQSWGFDSTTRRRIPLDQRALRQDTHLYPQHIRILQLAIERHSSEGWNASDVVRAALELYAREELAVELGLDEATQAQECVDAFKAEHNGKMPTEIMAEKAAEADRLKADQTVQDQKLGQAGLETEKKVYLFLKKRNPEDSKTFDWFRSAWYKTLTDQGWKGNALQVMHNLLAKGDKEGWPTNPMALEGDP